LNGSICVKENPDGLHELNVIGVIVLLSRPFNLFKVVLQFYAEYQYFIERGCRLQQKKVILMYL